MSKKHERVYGGTLRNRPDVPDTEYIDLPVDAELEDISPYEHLKGVRVGGLFVGWTCPGSWQDE